MTAPGRGRPVDAFSANGRYLRSPDGWSRRIADVAERGLERILLGGKRSFVAVWPGLPQSLSDTTCFASKYSAYAIYAINSSPQHRRILDIL
jgi:hypothetical protein